MTEPVRTRKTARSTVRRRRERGTYDRAVVYQVLDEALICHVGFAIEGRPWVIPTIHTRLGDQLYLHGARTNHMLTSLRTGVETCVTATLVDGLVLARSALHHSVNYRSVCLFGRSTEVRQPEEKRAALGALVDHVMLGRASDARRPTERELHDTLVIRLPIDEASAKVRTGPPLDDPDDIELDAWAGVVPLRTVTERPVPAPDLSESVQPPSYLLDLLDFPSDVGHGPLRGPEVLDPDPHGVTHHVQR